MILIFYSLLMWKFLLKDVYQEFEVIVIKSIDHKFHVTIASLKLVFKNSFVLKEMF